MVDMVGCFCLTAYQPLYDNGGIDATGNNGSNINSSDDLLLLFCYFH